MSSLLRSLNYRLIEWQKKRRLPVVLGYPYWLTVDPSSICNLRCVFCPTGQRRGTRPSALLSLSHFKKLMRKLGPYLLHVDFCNWGEPMMNKDLAAMIACAKRYGVTTKVDSNLSLELTEADAEGLVRSGLDRLIMSVDGASQATYEVYRRGGDFIRAIGNMKLLVAKKRELGAATPHLHWQFLVFKHNEHEIEAARRMAAEIGVDSIGFTAPFCAPEWVSTKDEYNNYIVKDEGVAFKSELGACNWLWDALTVNADGSVSPCCSVEDGKDDFGSFFGVPFWALWNNRKFRAARAAVRKKMRSEHDPNVCIRCDHRGASNHADAVLR